MQSLVGVFILVLLLLWGPSALGVQTQIERVVLPAGTNRTLFIAHLHRAAMADPKVAKVRAIPPDNLLITAKAKGNSLLRVWTKQGAERVFGIEVVAAHLGAQTQGTGVVKVALQFLEMDDSAREETGFRWPELVSGNAHAVVQGAGLAAGLSYTIGLGNTRGWLQQLVRDGRARLLANPEIYVRLGEQATFSSGGEIPVPATSESYGRVQKHVEWKPFGMSVKVRPESADTYHLQSDIQVELSELNPSQSVGGIPALSRRELTTKVNSVDGETVLLSGLVRQLSSVQNDGVPLLKDLPVVGMAFSSRTQSRESHEVLMAVTFSLATRRDWAERVEVFDAKFGKQLKEPP